MPVHTSMVLICDMCGLHQAADAFDNPVDAAAHYGWEYYEGGTVYCGDCQHKLPPLAHVQPEASRYDSK